MDEMLPCPFCGSEEIEWQYQTEDREGIPINAMCCDCGACGPWVYTTIATDTKKATEAWNQRIDVMSDITKFIKEIKGRIDVTNTLPEQQRALIQLLEWAEEWKEPSCRKR